MKTSVRYLFFTASLALVCGLVFAAELPLRDDYAYGFVLEPAGDSEFFQLDFPLEIYRSVADPTLRDIGVYNADGQPVPRIIERPDADEVDVEQELELGLIPLFGEQAKQPDQLRLLLHRDANSTRLELDSERAAAADHDDAAETQQPLRGYLIDVRELEVTLQQLELDWPPMPQGFIGTVWLEDSDDLQHWRRLGSSALADLQFEETRIEQKRLKLPMQTRDFLRISLQNLPPDWRLSHVKGIHTKQGPQAAREWLSLDHSEVVEAGREYVFNAGGYLPVDRVNLELADDNVVLRASVFYRLHEEDSWRLAQNGIYYNISRRGSTLQSAAVTLDQVRTRPVRAGQWKVRIETGMTGNPPRLQLGWRPDRLVFLAQGAQPFELVSGRADDELQQFPQETLLGDRSIFRMLRKSGTAGDASLGARMEITGPQGLRISDTPSWKVLLVWAGLIAAIALVGWLVYSLLHEMRQITPPSP